MGPKALSAVTPPYLGADAQPPPLHQGWECGWVLLHGNMKQDTLAKG